MRDGVRAIRLQTLRSRAVGMAVYVYRAGPWVIDAGCVNARRQLLTWAGIDGAEACLITHHDEDHVGNAAALGRRGLTVFAPPPVVAALAEDRSAGRKLPLYRRWTWGTPERFEVDALTSPLDAGRWRLQPVHTPGHSADHFIYHEPNRRLVFSGDLYVGRRVPVARPRERLDELLASLRAVRDLAPESMFCAHRGPVERPVAALTAKIEWTEELIGRVRQLAAEGLEAAEITRQVLGGDGLMRFVSRGQFSRENLVRAALKVSEEK